MKNIDIYEIYKALFKALKSVYLGDLYLIIESITIDFDLNDYNEIMALEPFCYTVKGRYGRETCETEAQKLDESFSLTFDIKYNADMIQALFTEKLLLEC